MPGLVPEGARTVVVVHAEGLGEIARPACGALRAAGRAVHAEPVPDGRQTQSQATNPGRVRPCAPLTGITVAYYREPLPENVPCLPVVIPLENHYASAHTEVNNKSQSPYMLDKISLGKKGTISHAEPNSII